MDLARTARRLAGLPILAARTAAAGAAAGVLLPVATLRLVLRADAVLEEHAALLDELPRLLEPLRTLAATLERLQPVLASGAPTLEHLVAALDETGPVLDQLGRVGADVVPVLRELDALLDPVVAQLRAAAATLPPDLAPRLLALLEAVEADLPRIAAVGDPRHGLAAVAANTDHLVELADDLVNQVQSLPGAALLRRTRRTGRPDAELSSGRSALAAPPAGRPLPR